MADNYTFLFAPLDATGHMNPCIGLAEQLRNRQHKIVFATHMSWKGKLGPLGFIEELLDAPESQEEKNEAIQKQNEGDKFVQIVAKSSAAAQLPPIERYAKLYLELWTESFNQTKHQHRRLKEIMAKVKPDFVIVDQVIHVPALMDSGTPWMLCVSYNPVGISRLNVPPPCSGYAEDSDRSLWQIYDNVVNKVFYNYTQEVSNWSIENGGPEIEGNFPRFVKPSPWGNLYMYPLELDYTYLRPNPPNWYRFDTFIRNTEGSFEIPEKLKTGQGKLVYFSMGTIGSADIDLMKRLIKIFSKSQNRFIVSKGPLGDELELADNMWGENSVPQTRVLPLVDLVITHGGNNTVTESFYFGKRMLVLGHLWDQLDNAQRIHETGLGLRLNPYEATEAELLRSIEKLLADDLLERRMKSIAKRIQSTKSQCAAADFIESIARNNPVGGTF